MTQTRAPFVPIGTLLGEARYAVAHNDPKTALRRLDEYAAQRQRGIPEPRRGDRAAALLRARASARAGANGGATVDANARAFADANSCVIEFATQRANTPEERRALRVTGLYRLSIMKRWTTPHGIQSWDYMLWNPLGYTSFGGEWITRVSDELALAEIASWVPIGLRFFVAVYDQPPESIVRIGTAIPEPVLS